MKIVRQIEKERLRRGWSKAKLAREAGVRRESASRILNEHTSPTTPILEKLLKAVDLKVGR